VTCFVIGILSLIMSAGGFYAYLTAGSGVPASAELVSISGSLDHNRAHPISRSRDSTSFWLHGAPIEYQYLSKGGRMAEAARALRSSEHDIRVLVSSSELQAARTGHPSRLDVYEIEIDGELIQSYDDFRAHWISDDRIGLWIGIAFSLSGVFMIWCGLRQKFKRGHW
jgi:hypothetical protein